jgi:hypothetical protein
LNDLLNVENIRSLIKVTKDLINKLREVYGEWDPILIIHYIDLYGYKHKNNVLLRPRNKENLEKLSDCIEKLIKTTDGCDHSLNKTLKEVVKRAKSE